MLAIRLAVMVLAAAWTVLAHGHGADVTRQAVPAAPALAERHASVASDLTVDLLARVEAHRRGGLKAATREGVLEAARARRDHLAALVAHDPSEVLRVALPAALRATLPSEVRDLVEESVEASGELEVLHADHVDAAFDHYVRTLATPSGRYALHFAGEAPDAPTGSRLSVRGVRIGSAIAVADRADLLVDKASAMPFTTGPQRTLAILVNFQSAPTVKPYTVAQVESLMFGTTSAFDYEASYQQTTVTGDVAGWFTIPLAGGSCDYAAIMNYARAAAAGAGYALSDYRRFVYIFPPTGCAWWGLGTVGGNPSHAWVHTKWGLSLNVVGHEMGHNLGLFHAHSLDCGWSTLASSGCTASEYGDVFDLMGNNVGGHYSAYQKERIGWLDDGVSPPITTVPAVAGTATYDIGPLEDARNGVPRALKIPRVSACGVASEWFYVEARQAKGYDAFLAGNANVLSGVLVHKVTDGNPDSGYLLDMTPSTSAWSDAALPVGKSYTDPQSGVKIAPVSVGSDGARVQVTFPPASCTRMAPAVSLQPGGTVWTPGGVSVSFTVQAQNRDACGCAPTAFDVGAAVPAGWGTTGARTASVAPGTTTSATIAVTPAQAATAAFYPLTITARNVAAPTLVAATASTVAIEPSATPPPPTPSAALAATVATSASSYRRPWYGSTGVPIVTTAKASGVAVAGASVSLEVRDPRGRAVTGTTTTGANGSVTITYSVRSDAATGTYAVTSRVTQGASTATATTAFTVY
jgi:hypothetical protein